MNAEYIFKAKDSNGNDVDCIGSIFAIELSRNLFDIEEVRRACTTAGIDHNKYFKEQKKETAFTNAVSAMTKYFKRKGYILHKVSDDSSAVVYSLDKKRVNTTEKTLAASDTNTEITLNVNEADYENVASFIYDRGNDRVLTDTAERLSDLVKVLNQYINSYTKNQFRLKVNEIIEKLGGCINWRKKGGVYFVPARHRDVLNKVVDVVNNLDSKAVIKIGEVPNLQQSRRAVATSVDEEVQAKIKDLKVQINELYLANDFKGRKSLTIVEKLGKEIKELEQYKIICESNFTETSAVIAEAQEIVKDILLTGKTTRKIVEEVKPDEELADLLADL